MVRLLANKIAPEQPLARRQQPVDDGGVAIALLLQPHHGGARGSGQRRLARPNRTPRSRDRSRPPRRSANRDNRHRSASFSLEECVHVALDRRRPSTKAAPMPRARMNVSMPRFTFLSCAINSIRRSTEGSPPGMSCAAGSAVRRLGEMANGALRLARRHDAAGEAGQS